MIIPTQGLPSSLAAEERALEVAHRYGASAVAVHVLEEPGGAGPEAVLLDVEGVMRREAGRALGRVLSEAKRRGVPCETVLLHGDPADALVRFARPDDLIVMSTHARKGWGRFLLGSVTEEVVRRARSNVLVVRNPGA